MLEKIGLSRLPQRILRGRPLTTHRKARLQRSAVAPVETAAVVVPQVVVPQVVVPQVVVPQVVVPQVVVPQVVVAA
jgi:hypothetical protein